MSFSREITNVLSTGLDCYNCLLCFFMIGTLLSSVKNNPRNKFFIYICICLVIFNITDMANWIAEGISSAWKPPYLHIMTFFYYAIVPFSFISLIMYIETFVYPKKISKTFKIVSLICSFLYLILVFATPFTGAIYYFTPDNYYQRGSLNFLSVIFFLLFFLIIFILVIHNRKYFTRKEFLAFLSYPLFPIVMELIQLKFYGLSLVNMGMTLSILLIFLNLHQNLETTLVETEKEIQTQEDKMIKFQEHTIISLSNLVENRDTETGEHARRTSLFVELLARKTMKDGYYTDIIDEEYIKRLTKAAPMHDIGKIVVSDTVLKKAGRLDSVEFDQMKLHAEEGGRIVNDIIGLTDDKEYVKIAVDIAKYHHERWDGTGYPYKLANEEIPLSARIMAIADVFDALVFERCYKKPIPPVEAFQIIQSESETHFDPILVGEFLSLQEEVERIIHIYQD